MYSKLCLMIAILLTAKCCAAQRTLKSELNPGCNDLCRVENVTTFYLRAEGASDTLHYLWDFFGNPSLLLAVTDPSAELRINWQNYLVNAPNSINFTVEPRYTFGIAIKRFFEFDDINDTGLLDTMNETSVNVLNTELFEWIRQGILNTTQFVELQMDGSHYYDPMANIRRRGNVQIMFNGFCTKEHSDVMPHMLHSENSTQIDIIFNNLETNSTYTHSRFGLELLLVSETNPGIGMSIDAKKSLDDEYTPEVFEVVELRTPHVQLEDRQDNSAYLQWRPVSYIAASRDVTETTKTVYYPLVNVTDRSNVAKHSLLHAYYGPRINNLLVEKINMSIGMKGDGFYKRSNYTTMTFIVGYGIPPAEQFSHLVIMIISIGLGLPILIILGLGIYFCFRRLPKTHNNASINS